MSGTRVLYVTRTGHARALAEEAARLVGAAAVEIGDGVARRGVIGFIKSGRQAAQGAATPIVDPGIDLSGADAVILAQPVWAGSVCPPLRSWLRAHGAELAGKKLGLLASNMGSPGEPLKVKFEKEFGKLASFAVIPQRLGAASRTRAIEAFVNALK
jgi:hypothetical protein